MAMSMGQYPSKIDTMRSMLTTVHSVIGQVNTILKALYSTEYTNSPAQRNVNSIAFAGTVVGQLFFGWMSDHYSRKWALVTSTVILFIFAALSAGSFGGGSIHGMLAALTAWRFLLGIGIGSGLLWTFFGRQLTATKWRISRGQCRMRRKHWGAQGRTPEQVVHHVHERPN